MNNDEFKIGDRVFFLGEHDFGIFGNVEKVERDGQCLLVRADNMSLYEIFENKVTKLNHERSVLSGKR